MYKHAVMMELPEGKLPGFYAQVVKALANKTALWDRDKELLIVNSAEEAGLVKEVLARFRVPNEDLLLIMLPEDARMFQLAYDYGFQSRSGLSYLYAHMVLFFRFVVPNSQAYLQMEEYLIATFEFIDETFYAVDRQWESLIHGIAKAYKSQVIFATGSYSEP